VTRLTQRLPVALVPEELFISTVGFDVIHHCSLDILPFPMTTNTKGMAL
jgi:hypothetical protein